MIRTEVAPTTPPQLFAGSVPPMSQLTLAMHTFEIDAGGLWHHCNGVLRACVPPEGWDDYGAVFPAAMEAIEAHRLQVAGQLQAKHPQHQPDPGRDREGRGT